MNIFTADGNAVKNPELRMTGSGKSVATLRVAFNTSRKDADGKRKPAYMDVVGWEWLAERISKNIEKGDHVIVTGEIQDREFQRRDGTTAYEKQVVAREIYFEKRESKNRPSYGGGYNDSSDNEFNPHYLDGAEEVTDEELPF